MSLPWSWPHDRRRSKCHGPEDDSDGAKSWVRGMASIGRRLCAQVVEAMCPSLRTCKDVKELKERLTAWSLKVAEHEHQFKAIDEAQKTFVVREMMPKDIKREFLTGPTKFDEIMEKLEIIVNEMMADDGPVPMDLDSVGTHDTKMTQNDFDTSNDMSYEDVCATKDAGPARAQARRDRMDQEHGIVGKELMNGRAARKEARRAPMAASQTGTVTRTKGAREKRKGKGKGKSEIRYCYDCGEQGHIGVNCPSRWANSIDEEDDQTSSWERESLKERKLKNSRARKRMTRKESGAGQGTAESPDEKEN